MIVEARDLIYRLELALDVSYGLRQNLVSLHHDVQVLEGTELDVVALDIERALDHVKELQKSLDRAQRGAERIGVDSHE